MNRMCSAYFSSNGSWTAPAGVTRVYLLGHGGGGGGQGGSGVTGNTPYGGYGTIPYLVPVTVVPNTTYAITIGAGGTGGAGGAPGGPGTGGNPGGATSFGALYSFQYDQSFNQTGGNYFVSYITSGGFTGIHPAYVNGAYYVTNQIGTLPTSGHLPGTSGGPGYYGSVPGTGGNGNSSGVGQAGGNATGFGAAGGGGGSGSGGGGNGGNGAPGQLWVMWVE